MLTTKYLKNILNFKHYIAIVANGQFPTNHYIQKLIQQANVIIACDGAIDKLLQHQIIPNYIIGDCDSISAKNLKQYAHIIHKITNQDTTDLTKAVQFAKEKNFNKIIIFGGTGLREDHTLGNISKLLDYAEVIPEISMISDYGIFNVSNKNATFSAIIGQQISFFSTYNTIITCQELKWPLNNFVLNSWNQGTLNEATQNTISIISNHPILIFRAFCIK